MAAWYSTFGVCKDGKEVARFCAFKKKRSTKGSSWHLHNGKLQPADHSDLRNVKVKVCPDPSRSSAECEAEMRKLELAEIIIKMCPQLQCFGVASTFTAVVNKDSNVNCAKFPRRGIKTIKDGTTVLVQDRYDGHIERLLDLERDEHHSWDSVTCSDLHNLVMASYWASGGRCVISGLKGVRGYGPLKYLITSLTVHSVTGKEFGSKDNGNAGVQAFVKYAGCELPTDLLDPTVLVDILKTKALRAKATKTLHSTLLAECAIGGDSDCNMDKKPCGFPKGILDLALAPSSVWKHHDNIRVFLGKEYDADEY